MYTPKRHEPCVLFLEDAFGSGKHPKTLRDAGFTVECFGDHFPDATRGKEQNVKDPRIINLCHEKNFVLITTDKNLPITHAATIKKTEIAIIATANNNADPAVWVQAIISAKARIERHCKKVPRPSFATISKTGNLTVRPISISRRHRPREGQEK